MVLLAIKLFLSAKLLVNLFFVEGLAAAATAKDDYISRLTKKDMVNMVSLARLERAPSILTNKVYCKKVVYKKTPVNEN